MTNFDSLLFPTPPCGTHTVHVHSITGLPTAFITTVSNKRYMYVHDCTFINFNKCFLPRNSYEVKLREGKVYFILF